MDKISPEEKIQWMKKILQKKESISSVASKIGVYYTTVDKWLRNYKAIGPEAFFMNLFPHFGQVISTFPFPFGTRSFCLQTGHLKKRNNLASACSSCFSIIFSHNGRASLRKHSFSCALLSWLRENTRKMQPNSGR